MRLPLSIVVALTFALAAGLCLVAASFAVTTVEENSEIVVRRALDRNSHDWAEVQANGLRIIVTGTAKDEATRFNALTVVGDEVDPSRVIDEMQIAPSADLAPPRFSAEILRNTSGISIIGLIPTQSDRDEIVAELNSLAGEDNVTDLLETADYDVPGGWIDAMGFSLKALSMLPRSKVSVAAGQVTITAISDSAEAKQQLEDALNRAAPPGLRIGIDIAAPRPVITPFTMRFLIDEAGARFDACSAQDRIAQSRILAAARTAGIEGSPICTIGMGVPSPKWARASELSIGALAELGQGTVTIADADITLVAAQGTDQGRFDRVVGELEAELPEVFALHAVLPAPELADTAGPPEFTATLSPEGLVQLRGRLNDDNLRHMVDSYAKAAFGTDAVYTAARVVPDLPATWPVRVLAGLEALSMLTNGALTVTPDNVMLSGVSQQEDASARIAGVLSDKLGQAQTYDLSVTYRAPPEPEDKAPDPEVCEAEIALIQEAGKIAFEPGSATIAASSLDTMNRIADILDACGQIRLEIQGHTDSQGREEMNQQLSQARAQSVLNELRSRRILTSSYVAIGYGESQPIADNKTEDGREANRRIEFRLIRPETSEEGASTLDAIAEEAPSEVFDERDSDQEEDTSQSTEEDQ
ncbi:OmpA family protein [Tropicibacter sp. Alg240-R139]|uniref:OmpA family protein n=1 Tax=Tropicibacter sp. Alg240-R139 TaxID=2305991 RepID=UPI0013DED06D|nr:OmpA family protein [Tropicibacter sp. Alg240-R139]